MAPIGELRVSLPAALTIYQLNWGAAYLISVIGNLVPVVFLLLFLEPVSNWLSRRSEICQKFFFWLFAKTRKQYSFKMKKYGYPALIAFIAIPLPITGGWTGSIIAFLFKIPVKIAFSLISLGVIIAGAIVLATTQAGIVIEKYFGWQILVGILLVIGFIWIMYNKVKNKKA